MSCHECSTAAEKPWHGFRANCPGCAARATARSPDFRRVQDAGRLDRAYLELLERLGLSYEQVKAAAAADKGSTS